MKQGWIAAVLIGAALCLGLGISWGWWKAGRRTEAPLRDDLGELGKIDPRLVICAEAGRLPTGLATVRGLAVGPEDLVYVVGDTALVVLKSDGSPVSRREAGGPASCVAVDADSTVYLGMRDHVEVLDARGEKKASWERPDARSWITSLAVSADGVYASDFGLRTVLRYDKAGKLVGRIGARDKEKAIPGFLVPSPYFDVAVDPAGSLWVANTGRHRLENYRSDGSLVSSWGGESARIEGFSGCCNPSHFALRRDGSFVTAEKGLVRIKIHDPAGRFLGVVAGPKDFPGGITGLDVAADSKGRILVLDPSTSAVRVYVGKARD